MTNVTDRMAAYLYSLEPEAGDFLKNLREYAMIHNVPIVRRETESFLRTVVRLKGPQRILEIGAAIGYSAVVMAESSEAKIVTVESYDKRIPIAAENIKNSGFGDRIELIHGDAGEILKTLPDQSYDLVFLDAAKAQYIVWYEDILRVMKPHGVLISDNVLQDNTVLESRFSVTRRDRTTHERMREFLRRIKHDERLESSVIPVGDGVSVSVLK